MIYFHERLCRQNVAVYANAIQDRGAPLANVFGFIDGTKIAITRPKPRPGRKENLQKQVYSGHKRIHCLNFQSVVVPDGLAIHFWGPVEGKRHDITLLRESMLLEFFAERSDVFGGYYLYGDPAYGVQRFILSAFRQARLTETQQAFNARMSSVRECVEWKFAHLKMLFAFIDYKKSLKLRMGPIGKYVIVSMFLANCHTCYNGKNQISEYFGVQPPPLEDYLIP